MRRSGTSKIEIFCARPLPKSQLQFSEGFSEGILRRGFPHSLERPLESTAPNQGAPKGRQQKGETGPRTHIFADFCRFSLISGSLCKSRDLGVADLRRKPQETADFRRIFADFCRNRFLAFAVSLLARSYLRRAQKKRKALLGCSLKNLSYNVFSEVSKRGWRREGVGARKSLRTPRPCKGVKALKSGKRHFLSPQKKRAFRVKKSPFSVFDPETLFS